MIDLHCHSSASDGVLEPGALPKVAKEHGLRALALTDHDTLDGIEEFLRVSREIGFAGIPGVELSCTISSGDKCHIVGLFVDHTNAALQDALVQIRKWREERNEAIIAKLNGLGIPVTREQALACGTGKFVLGRPHIADAVVKLGFARNMQEVFSKFIGRSCPAYVSRKVLPVETALPALRAAGGVSIWAHPFVNTSMTLAKCTRFAEEMMSYGLDGIEAYYPTFTSTNTENVLQIAKKTGLLVSGGTDFHGGSRHVGIHIGTGYGNGFCVPDQLLEPIQKRALEYRSAP